jgi:hypothetical protein
MTDEWDLAEIDSERRRRLMDAMGDGIALIDASGASPDPLLRDENLPW